MATVFTPQFGKVYRLHSRLDPDLVLGTEAYTDVPYGMAQVKRLGSSNTSRTTWLLTADTNDPNNADGCNDAYKDARFNFRSAEAPNLYLTWSAQGKPFYLTAEPRLIASELARFTLEVSEGDWRKIVRPAHDWRDCADVQNAEKNAGTTVINWSSNSGDNQQWRLEMVG